MEEARRTSHLALERMEKAARRLKQELVPFALPKIGCVVDELFTRGIFSDGAAHLVELLVTCLDFFTLCPSSKGDIMDPNLKSQYNTYRLPALVKRILAIILKPRAYCAEFIAKWRELRLDVILCPALGPAFNHGYAGKLFAATSYTNLYNVLSFPAGVVPASAVTSADEEELKHCRGHYRDPWDKRLKEAVEGAEGLCLHFMKEPEALACGTERNV